MRIILTFLVLPACWAQSGAADGATRADWPHYGGTQLSWRYTALDQVNTANVKNLSPAWIFQTGDYSEGLQATPIVVDGVMYIITARAQVFALNAATGAVLWHYRYPPVRPPGIGGIAENQESRGVAVGNGMVFFGTADNYMVALDQKTGREVWKVSVDDTKQCGCSIAAAPLVVKDKVVVGGNGGDQAHRGYLTAFNSKTGRLAWRWYVVPAPGEKGNETWKGDSWRYGGGAPWMTGSYDSSLNLIYWGTGNAASDFYDADRVPSPDKSKDTNLYTASVVALDADTGKLRWHYQEVPDDVWDFDSAYEVLLMDRQVRGRMRQILVHMNKSGLTFVLDRATGEFLGVFSTPEVRNWITGVTEDGKLVGRNEPKPGKTDTFCPSAAGAKSWNSMAYSPRTGFIYTPINELCAALNPTTEGPQEGRGFMNSSMDFKLPPGRTTYSHLDAWDPVTGKRAWSYPYKYILLASVLATAGDLVFTGDPEGNFIAFNAKTGAKAWSYQTGAGHRGSSMSYAVNGRQFIATPVGWQALLVGGLGASLFGDLNPRIGSTIIAFALPEGSK
ncbi:MAG: PQQ-dependent dehydrogenase, methanol/ethanol family [Bryobacterales bacterium]|nr:PQQ-dependent dehydrogenase, methanol/ethanol family [Bryobacterales bacterium]MBV9396610.1 PQQ-dependent dehydrogenase, methanol/ethanol family [Bryobacterales bacterium]